MQTRVSVTLQASQYRYMYHASFRHPVQFCFTDFTDSVSEKSTVVGRVRLSLFSLFPLYLLNPLTFDLDFL